jgi:LPS sulfotransferase NodH
LENEQVFERTGVHTIASCAEKYGCKSVADYLKVVAGLTRTANGVFGLKMDLYHASILIRRGLFCNPGWNWKYIYVTRRDLLMQAISCYTAQETGLWSSLSVGDSAVEFNEEAIADPMLYLAELMSRWECLFSLLGIEPLRIAYEDIESVPRETVARCLRHIGVELTPDQIPIASSYRRQRTRQADEWAQELRARIHRIAAATLATS